MTMQPYALWLVVLIGLVSPMLLACAGEVRPISSPMPAQGTAVPAGPDPTLQSATVPAAPNTTAPPEPEATLSPATPTPGTMEPDPTVAPSPIPVPPPLPLPTPHAGNSEWSTERLEAVIRLYGLTSAGAALLHSLDFRQMRGEPGFFGSYGFGGWAGVGEAKPIGVMHELAHSYWGGFPVIGRPELVWGGQ